MINIMNILFLKSYLKKKDHNLALDKETNHHHLYFDNRDNKLIYKIGDKKENILHKKKM